MDVPHALEQFDTYATFRHMRQQYQQFGFLTSTTDSAASASAFTSAVLRPHITVVAAPVPVPSPDVTPPT